MSRRRASSAPGLLLALLCAGLGGVFYWQWTLPEPPPAPRPEATAVKTGGPVRLKPVTRILPALDSLSEVTERPLFFADRRQPELADQPVAQAGLPALDVTVIGVFSAGNGRRALLKTKTRKSSLTVAPGDDVSGWTVESIEEDKVIFRHGDTVAELELKLPKPQPAQRPPSPRDRLRNNAPDAPKRPERPTVRRTAPVNSN